MKSRISQHSLDNTVFVTKAEMPSGTLIGENSEETKQGKVYDAHFAFPHLWWAIEVSPEMSLSIKYIKCIALTMRLNSF